MLKLFSKYTIVGAAGTLAHYMVLILLVEMAAISATLAAFAGAVTGALLNYLLNYYFVFESNKSHQGAMLKFFTIAGFGVLLSTGIVHLFTLYHADWYLAGQLIATLLHLVLGFLINKRYTF